MIVAWLVLLAVLAALSLRGFGQFELGTRSDDGLYALLARSLVFDGGYDVRTGPGPPQETVYPFAFPLLLAPLVAARPDAIDYLTLPSLAATLFNTSLLFWGWPWLSRNGSRRWGLVIAPLYALNPLTIGDTNMVMSEAVFTSFTLSALITAEAAARRPVAWRFVLLGFLATSACYTRTVGVVLVAAVAWRALTCVRGRAWRRAGAMTAGGMLLIAPVLLFTPIGPRNLLPVRYLAHRAEDVEAARRSGEMAAALEHAGSRVHSYATALVRAAIVPVGGGQREADLAVRLDVPWLPELAGLLVTVFVLIGATASRAEQRLAPSVLLFEVLYFGTIVAWPFLTVRFLYPVLPFLTFQFLTGVQRSAATALPVRLPWIRFPHALAACFAVALAIGSIWKDLSPIQTSAQFARDFRREGEWLRSHSPPDAVVMTEYPVALRLHADRRTVAAPAVASAADLLRQLDAYDVGFVEIGPKLEWRLDGQRQYSASTAETFFPFLERLHEEGRVSLVYESDPRDLIRIYRIEPTRAVTRPTSEGHGPAAEIPPRSG